jgi:hypothetical protein
MARVIWDVPFTLFMRSFIAFMLPAMTASSFP